MRWKAIPQRIRVPKGMCCTDALTIYPQPLANFLALPSIKYKFLDVESYIKALQGIFSI